MTTVSNSSPNVTNNNNTTSTADPPESVAVDSDFVVILAALLCALICVVGLVAVARCAWLRRTSRSSSDPRTPANKGLKKSVLRSLPKLTFNGNNSCKLADCAICLSEFVDGDEIRVLPQCAHVFHVGCIDTWLGSHSSCPSCRQILVVARCQKCGGFQDCSNNNNNNNNNHNSTVDLEAGLKAREDDVNRFLP